MHPASLPLESLLAECEVRRQRRSGPGGQHRNKVETAVIIKHRPTGVAAEANERRSQEENRREAVFRLRKNLAVAIRSAVADPARYVPSPLWKSRTCGGLLSISPRHADFPAILAEALDVVAAYDYEVKSAAAVLDVTTTQLLKLLKQEPAALNHLNQERSELHLRPLK